MGDDTGRKGLIFFLIFFVCSIILLSYILVHSVRTYSENKEKTDDIAEVSYDCSLYAFNIYEDTITYLDGKLSFKIKNTIGEKFDILVLEGNNTKETYLFNFISGSDPIDVSEEVIPQDGKIQVYPKGCQHNAEIIEVTA